MIMNPKIGDYIWFICRWTDLPVLGQVTSLKIDPANKNFPYERPYAEVDWYNGENPSEPGPWCGSTSVLLKDLFERPHPTDVGWGFYWLAPVKPR